eukprot:scaffold36664_cov36-Prasinocladus_malaysianus.AAC.1
MHKGFPESCGSYRRFAGAAKWLFNITIFDSSNWAQRRDAWSDVQSNIYWPKAFYTDVKSIS